MTAGKHAQSAQAQPLQAAEKLKARSVELANAAVVAIANDDFKTAAQCVSDWTQAMSAPGLEKQEPQLSDPWGAVAWAALHHRGSTPLDEPEGWRDFAILLIGLPGVVEFIVKPRPHGIFAGAEQVKAGRDFKALDLELQAWEIARPWAGGWSEPKNQLLLFGAFADGVRLWAPQKVVARMAQSGMGPQLTDGEKVALFDFWSKSSEGLGVLEEHEHGEIARDSLRGLLAAGWIEKSDLPRVLSAHLSAALQRAADLPIMERARLAKAGCAAWALVSEAQELGLDSEPWESWLSSIEVLADFCLQDVDAASARPSGWAQALRRAMAQKETLELISATQEAAVIGVESNAQGANSLKMGFEEPTALSAEKHRLVRRM